MTKAWILAAIWSVVALQMEGTTDWTQWRGPARNGISAEIGNKFWPASLKSAWSVEVGNGHSSPVLSNGTVYIFSREKENEVARAINVQNGKVLWRTEYPAPYREYPGAAEHGRGPKSTPVIHAGKLFTFGISGILSGFSASDGKILWQKNFEGRFPATAPPFGTSMSPLVEDGLLIVHAGGHEGGALLALDPQTGQERWNLSGDGPSYSSPIVFPIAGRKQIVIQVHRKILGVDLASGKLLWSLPFVTPCDQNIITPVVAGDLLVFSSLDKGTFAVRLKPEGEKWMPQTIWSRTDVSLYMSTPVVSGDRIVGFSHKRKGQFFALETKTGKVIWTSDAGVAENASIIIAGTDILLLKDDAELLVLAPDAQSFKPVASYQVAKSSTWAHPVPTAKGILIKDSSSLTLLSL